MLNINVEYIYRRNSKIFFPYMAKLLSLDTKIIYFLFLPKCPQLYYNHLLFYKHYPIIHIFMGNWPISDFLSSFVKFYILLSNVMQHTLYWLQVEQHSSTNVLVFLILQK